MKSKSSFFCMALLALALPAPVSAAGDPELDALRAEIAALKSRLSALESKTASVASGRAAPVELTAGPKGFRLRSVEGDSELRAGGLIQGQGRFFADSAADGDTFLLRRVRPLLEGRLYRDFKFRIQPELANEVTLLDAHIDWVPREEFALRVGKFKSPFGLERLQSAADLMFVERGLPTNLVPNRDLGIMAYGDLWKGLLHYDLAALNGVRDAGSFDSVDENQGKEVVGRLMLSPFKRLKLGALAGFSFGVATSLGDHEGLAPSYKTPGQETFFRFASGTQVSGDQMRVSPQIFWSLGPVGLLGEYVVSEYDVARADVRKTLSHESWQLASNWAVTGETVTFKGVKVKHPTHERGIGAWILGARYGELDIDDAAFTDGLASNIASASKVRSAGVVLHWLPNDNVKLSMGYDYSWFDGGGTDGTRVTDRTAESVIFSQVQMAF